MDGAEGVLGDGEFGAMVVGRVSWWRLLTRAWADRNKSSQIWLMTGLVQKGGAYFEHHGVDDLWVVEWKPSSSYAYRLL